ncbi:MEMO1 family [Dissophora ornata]|nr:MEMO1 family [Dissophora ornata]
MSVREPTHAGSWYSSNSHELHSQLAGWLTKAGEASPDGDPLPIEGLRAIIAPHAGYSYSGPAAGYAYKCIQPDLFKRVFILGPSHHVYLSGCAISKCSKYTTPLGDLTIDQEVNKALEKTGKFGFMSQETDEDEHSIEMHLPYVHKVFEAHLDKVKIVPILVGALTESTEKQYGKLLAPFLHDPENLFIVSSDFCHWGQRFSYTYYADNDGTVTQSLAQLPSGTGRKHSPSSPKISESIEKLDREGMEKIEEQNHSSFCRYLSRTKNTICGRHPIGVLMSALETIKATDETYVTRTRFVHYAQSSSALSTSDSSVSYASAFIQRKAEP